MEISTIIWILGGAVSCIGILLGVVWKLLRAEAKSHQEQINLKADKERVVSYEADIRRKIEKQEELLEKFREESVKRTEQLAEKTEARIESMTQQLTSLQVTLASLDGKVNSLGNGIEHVVQLLSERK